MRNAKHCIVALGLGHFCGDCRCAPSGGQVAKKVCVPLPDFRMLAAVGTRVPDAYHSVPPIEVQRPSLVFMETGKNARDNSSEQRGR